MLARPPTKREARTKDSSSPNVSCAAAVHRRRVEHPSGFAIGIDDFQLD
jgi:hypothetical protein